MAFSSGDKLGPYKILAHIGTGGMGEVYRARDPRLGRDIAVKVLPESMARDPERMARFQREARAVAALNHPHIVTIFSVEEAEGSQFFTMELVEGQPLDRLISDGGLPGEQIVEIAGALADALAGAHEKGIVHRDLKPANIMFTHDGRVKVLDFGLAKDIREADTGDLTRSSAGNTQAGIVMGTPAYMSPEQISGHPLDHRTDIFSLGVVLHEMATGRQPFGGNSSAELISAILRDTPAPVTASRPDLPRDLARIIRRCLEKDPRHRIQTARDVANEFRDLARQTSKKEPAPSSASRPIAATDSGATRSEEGFWIAILPFKYFGSNPELAAVVEGLAEDIVTGLSHFSYLRVIARSSTSQYSQGSVDIRSIGKELGARYVMEGSLRQAGSKLRLTVQLVDAVTGAHLWAENFERTFNPDSAFELQDDLVPRIVSTVADAHGILPRSMAEILRIRDPSQLSPYEAVLRSFAHFQRVDAEEHAASRTALERAVKLQPGYSDAWAMLSLIIREEFAHEFNLRPDPLGRALAAAMRAVEAAPSNHLAYHALAQTQFFLGDRASFRIAAERAIELNPADGFTIAFLGSFIAYGGDWERGCALTARARGLNPHHPGWYWFAPCFDAYRNGDYRLALEFARKVNIPNFWRTCVAMAASYGKLDQHEAAHASLEMLLRLRPKFASEARADLGIYWEPELVEDLIDGLRKAGLNIEQQNQAALPTSSSNISSKVKASSGALRAAEGFWVAVLPFKYTGNHVDLTSLVEGLTEDIVTGLSRFSYLRVIARSSTSQYSQGSVDIRSIGKELGARYVMEGSLRQAGSKLRLAVQLVDSVTGAHLWAENYERTFSPDALFELQDDLVPCIVSTIADQSGVLPRSMSEALRGKSEDDLTPHEAVLRAFIYFERVTPEEHANVKRILERAVLHAPDQPDCWAMLSMIYRGEYVQGFTAEPDPLGRAQAAAQRAVDLAPSNHLGWYALASAHFFKKDILSFRAAAERSLALNRMDGTTIAYLGTMRAASGDWEAGCAQVAIAAKLNPNHPGWYNIAAFANAYRKGLYQEALEAALRINMPGYFHTHAARAAAYGQLGQRENGQKAVRDLLALRPDFAQAARNEYSKWNFPEQVEPILDGLRKAGLEIPDEEDPYEKKP